MTITWTINSRRENRYCTCSARTVLQLWTVSYIFVAISTQVFYMHQTGKVFPTWKKSVAKKWKDEKMAPFAIIIIITCTSDIREPCPTGTQKHKRSFLNCLCCGSLINTETVPAATFSGGRILLRRVCRVSGPGMLKQFFFSSAIPISRPGRSPPSLAGGSERRPHLGLLVQRQGDDGHAGRRLRHGGEELGRLHLHPAVQWETSARLDFVSSAYCMFNSYSLFFWLYALCTSWKQFFYRGISSIVKYFFCL